MAADLVTDRVPGDGRGHHGDHHRRQRHVPHLGDPSEYGGGLTGNEEADEQGILDEDDQPDDHQDDPGCGAQDVVQNPGHGRAAFS